MNVSLRIWLPSVSISPVHWSLPAAELLLIVALLLDNPVDGSKFPVVRKIQVALSCGLVIAALWATGVLINDLVSADNLAQHANELLAVGGTVWLGNIYAFSIIFWLTDSGGPSLRAAQKLPRDFAFIQHQNPELDGTREWRPQYLDYLHLAFTNATAFSPTDAMPLSHRAKFTMVLQATVSLALVALVVARSVNAFA
ncbi:MAG: hypothetical protein ACRDKE_04690 [Solirubrobacterales bacterium]